MSSSIYSAPGKVLIAGGYLVLERPNCGVVVTVDSRVHVRVSAATTESHAGLIEVRSPQFQYVQQFSLSTNGGFLLQPVSAGEPNKFILYSVWFALAYAALFAPEFHSRMAAGLVIDIRGDATFYAESGKTGLGSSAALTVSLCGAVLHFCGVPERCVEDERQSLVPATHRVAQAAHAAAQGKLGSGFDIASATFGSGVYVRFTDSIIRGIMTQADEGAVPASTVADAIGPQAPWDHRHDPFALPPGIELALGAVAGGSSTPGMVSKVLQWKREHGADALPHWHALAELNTRIGQLCVELSAVARTDAAAYTAALQFAADRVAGEWTVDNRVLALLLQLRAAFSDARAHLRAFNRSGAEVEPPAQTALCDSTAALPGCIAAAVPGAGGFDALFALVLGRSARQRVEAFWRERGVQPLPVALDGAGLRADPEWV